jgi:hypothetical protein
MRSVGDTSAEFVTDAVELAHQRVGGHVGEVGRRRLSYSARVVHDAAEPQCFGAVQSDRVRDGEDGRGLRHLRLSLPGVKGGARDARSLVQPPLALALFGERGDDCLVKGRGWGSFGHLLVVAGCSELDKCLHANSW